MDYFIDLIEHQAKTLKDKPYILFDDVCISFKEFFQHACQATNGLINQGAKPGDGVGIIMGNCPEYLYLFFSVPMAGMYSVPINVSLKGDGLRFILENSDIRFLVIDDIIYPKYEALVKPVGKIEQVFIHRSTDQPLPKNTTDLMVLLDASSKRPDYKIKEGDITYLMFTSGTTGLPKGIVTRNKKGRPERIQNKVKLRIRPDDVIYTCLPLFHGSGLMLGAQHAMAAGVPFGLDKRFSASGFMDRIRHYGATTFNAISVIIPLLLKQPPKSNDRDNPLRLVVSSACPGHLWKQFEERFNVKVWEGYTAIDSGGMEIVNIGNAPTGSVGRPKDKYEWKLVDEKENEIAPGDIGELIYKKNSGSPIKIEYYKNEKATREKCKDGWISSGDLFYRDMEGYLYFVDRKTDSLRRRGENISSWEIENIVEKHPAVIECAAFGVKTDFTEDEVMVWVKLSEDDHLDLPDLIRFCAEHMAYYMVPRYIDIVDDIPKTGTLRTRKVEMKKRGVTERTWDREKEMPDLALNKI